MAARIAALGLDIGKRRIGVAGCDGLGLIATGIGTLERKHFHHDLHWFEQRIQERHITQLVAGLPYAMDGSLGFQAEKVQAYAERLRQALALPLDYVDERLTSVEAEEQLKQQKRFSRSNKGLVDQQAAVIILQQWLDQRRSALTPP